MSKLGGLIEDLKSNVYEKIMKEKEEKTKRHHELEMNVKTLELKLKLSKEELDHYHTNEIITVNGTSKIEYQNHRVKRELDFMNKEIPFLNENVNDVKLMI